MATPPLHGLRIIECSALGPGAITMPLVDLGAEVIKVEPPSGRLHPGDDLADRRGRLAHAPPHQPGQAQHRARPPQRRGRRPPSRSWPPGADVVVEAMRPAGSPGAGSVSSDLKLLNPKHRLLHHLGLRDDRAPTATYPSHGVAFDTWAGIVSPQVNDEGFAYLPEHASMGIHAGPLFGALGILAAVLRARATGEGSFLEIAQSDAAAAMDWYRSETWKAYERPESEVTGNKADDYERREPGTAGMVEGVRYQVYEAKDGRYVLFMASEQVFWKNFCEAVDRVELFERWPGSKFADHARGNLELQRRAPRHLPHQDGRGVARLRGRGQHPGRPGQHAEDIARRPPVRGPLPLDRRRPARGRPALHPAQFVGEELPLARPRPDRRPAHRGRLALRARL